MANVSSSNGLEKRPKLRFPGFDEPYRTITLGQIASLVNRTDPSSNAPIMMLSAGNGFIMQSEKYSRDNAGQSLKKYILLKKGELAYNHGASKAKQYGCCYELTEDEARIPYVYHCFKVSGTEHTPYVATALNNPKIDRQLKRLVSSSVRMDGLLNISFDDYMSVILHLPSLKEQTYIADFLKKLDERITAQEKLVASLKKYKRGLLSAVFSQNVSMFSTADFYAFSELAVRRSEKYDPKCNAHASCIELEHIEQETGRIIGSTCADYQNSIKTVCKPGDVMFGKLRPYLRKYAFVQKECVCSSEIWSLIPTDIVIPKYLFYLIQSEAFMKVANVSSGTKMPRAEWSTIAKSGYLIPSKDDQQATVDIFETTDRIIVSHVASYDRLIEYKKGLLQRLFI